MKICQLTTADFDQFLKFNQTINPDRSDVVERLKFQILENPLLEDKTSPTILVAYNDEGEIIGQHLHNPFEYHFRGKRLIAFYGYDFFVAENYRNKGIGSALARQARTDFYPHFGVGVSEVSQRIQLSLGNRIIGNLFTYIWIRNWLSPIKFGLNQLFKKKLINSSGKTNDFNFPDRISIGDLQFKRIDKLEQWNYEHWDNNVLEFSRSLNFINWRFLSKQDKYHFYILEESNATTYFVVRTIFARGLKLLSLVDYRTPVEDEKKFKTILLATKQLAKSGEYDGIFTMSSHRFFDAIFKRSHFLQVGRPIVVLTNAELEIDPKRINERKAVIATMAESDLDFYFEF